MFNTAEQRWALPDGHVDLHTSSDQLSYEPGTLLASPRRELCVNVCLHSVCGGQPDIVVVARQPTVRQPGSSAMGVTSPTRLLSDQLIEDLIHVQ